MSSSGGNGSRGSRGSKGVQILISLDVPTPGKYKTDHATKELSIEERVRAACELIDSGHESRKEWLLLQKLNNYLMRRKDRLTERQANVLQMVQPMIEKYGQNSPEGVEQDASKHSSTKRRR